MPPEDGLTDVADWIDAGSLKDSTYLDMIELGRGCATSCNTCGAYKGNNPEDRRVVPISLEQLERTLTQEVENVRTGVRFRVIDLCRSQVTSGVDMEPLGTGIFLEAAELIHSLSKGKSSLVAISHGVNCLERFDGDGKPKYDVHAGQEEKLKKMNDLLLSGVIPIFILSMDAARDQGLAGSTAKACHAKIVEMEKPDSRFMQLVEQESGQMERKKDLDGDDDESEGVVAERRARAKRELIDFVQTKMLAAYPSSSECPRGPAQHGALASAEGVELTTDEQVIADYLKARNGREEAVVEINARGYAATLHALMPAIEAGKKVSISLQGDDNPESLAFDGLSKRIHLRTAALLSSKYKVSIVDVNALFAALNISNPRRYAAVGRAVSQLGIKDVNENFMVVPDIKFVTGTMWNDTYKPNRARLTADGRLQVQTNRANSSYNDTVAPSDDNPWRDVNLAKKAVVARELSIFRHGPDVDMGKTA